MSDLVVITYPDETMAAKVMTTLGQLQKEYLIDLDDAVYVTKDASGKVSLHQSSNLEAVGAASGALWGMLFGLLFFVPIAGLAIGATAGWLGGKFTDYGIDDKFVKQLSAAMGPNTSAIFAVVRRVSADKVVPEISRYGGTVMKTSLSKEAEERLQAALGSTLPQETTTPPQPSAQA
jgi:uncharacterized membrane protein